MTLVLRYAVRSDVGLLREGNEDSAYAGPRLLAVADGMGGHAAGEVASSVTIASMAELDSEPPGGDMLAELSEAVAAANTRLQEMIIANPAVEGMGTTLTALFWSDGHAAVCHIGDSRGYLLRENELYQITHDHTLVQSLVDEGRISADDVSTHPQRSLLLRALDGRSIAEPDLSVHEAQPGDRYLLCSDGLSGVVSDETLRDTLASIAEPEAVTRQLIELALLGGGPDNITCIVADVTDSGTTRLPPTMVPVLAGAAANAGEPPVAVDGTGPFEVIDENHFDADGQRSLNGMAPGLSLDGDPGSLPLAVATQNGTGPNAVRARGGHRAQPRRAARTGRGGRRRWPIVTTTLVVLLAVIIGGGYLGWRWSQDQYYVGANSAGKVVIYRGVNQRIAGFSLSKPYLPTEILLSQVPVNYQQTLKANDAASSLADAKNIVATVTSAVNACKGAYTALRFWAMQDNEYQAKVALARKNKEPASKINKIAKPSPPPPKAGSTCPTPQMFGIAASAITPAASPAASATSTASAAGHS
jgi:PPM family protein phosphatase